MAPLDIQKSAPKPSRLSLLTLAPNVFDRPSAPGGGGQPAVLQLQKSAPKSSEFELLRAPRPPPAVLEIQTPVPRPGGAGRVLLEANAPDAAEPEPEREPARARSRDGQPAPLDIQKSAGMRSFPSGGLGRPSEVLEGRKSEPKRSGVGEGEGECGRSASLDIQKSTPNPDSGDRVVCGKNAPDVAESSLSGMSGQGGVLEIVKPGRKPSQLSLMLSGRVNGRDVEEPAPAPRPPSPPPIVLEIQKFAPKPTGVGLMLRGENAPDAVELSVVRRGRGQPGIRESPKSAPTRSGARGVLSTGNPRDVADLVPRPRERRGVLEIQTPARKPGELDVVIPPRDRPALNIERPNTII
jgi:hypothetical protein